MLPNRVQWQTVGIKPTPGLIQGWRQHVCAEQRENTHLKWECAHTRRELGSTNMRCAARCSIPGPGICTQTPRAGQHMCAAQLDATGRGIPGGGMCTQTLRAWQQSQGGGRPAAADAAGLAPRGRAAAGSSSLRKPSSAQRKTQCKEVNHILSVEWYAMCAAWVSSMQRKEQ